MKNELKEARERFQTELFYKFGKPVLSVIKGLSYEPKEFIPGSGDSAYLLRGAEKFNATVMIYESPRSEQLKDNIHFFPSHYHENAETIQVLEGEITFSGVGFDSFTLKEGDVYKFKPNVHHQATMPGGTAILLTYIPKFEKNEWSGERGEDL